MGVFSSGKTRRESSLGLSMTSRLAKCGAKVQLRLGSTESFALLGRRCAVASLQYYFRLLFSSWREQSSHECLSECTSPRYECRGPPILYTALGREEYMLVPSLPTFLEWPPRRPRRGQ